MHRQQEPQPMSRNLFAAQAFFHEDTPHLRRLTVPLILSFLLSAILICAGCGGGTSSAPPPPPPATPALKASVAAQGYFSAGETNASYTITVSDTGNGATSGTVTVADPPTGFTVTAISGTGWTCTLASTTCTRSDALAAGSSYPAITVTGNVTSANGTPVTIPVTVSGGGTSSPVTVTPTPAVTVAAPMLSIAKTHSGNFSTGQQGATYTVTVTSGATAGASNGKVTVTETVPSGETLVSMSGSGWTCPGAGGANTCDRSDALFTGASYPAITVTVNVAANATSPQVNQANVSGGGMTGPASTSDSTIIGTPGAPDLSIVKSHIGNFAAGNNGTFTLAVSNVGNGATTGSITVTDTLASQFTFVSGTASGWNCGAAGQLVTCTNAGPINASGSAPIIQLVVAISSSATGSISNTATVATAGDTNAANNSSTDTVTLTIPSAPASVAIVPPGPVVYAGGNVINVAVKVTNDLSGDVLTPSLEIGGVACLPTACGSVGSVTGTPGGGSYTVAYTPPASAGFNSTVSIGLSVSSNLSNSFAGTGTILVHPAGSMVVDVPAIPLFYQVVGNNTSPSLAATIYNDTGATTGADVELLANGYACPSNGSGGTICGTLTITGQSSGVTTTGTTGIPYTVTTYSYMPPATFPASPYDQPMILAVSKANPTGSNSYTFLILASGFVPRRNTETFPTGGPGFTFRDITDSDTGNLKTMTWSLYSGPTGGPNLPCQPTCGTLGPTGYFRNGSTIASTVLYTPPATVTLDTPDQFPQLSGTWDDSGSGTNFLTNITLFDGTCGTGNNGVLNGQYAFLVQGGGEGPGYATTLDSFTADGNGNITSGFSDSNRTIGAMTETNIPAQSSYSIGPDNRGCLTLVNSSGTFIYRIAVGTLDGSNHATQGRILRFDDYPGTGTRSEGLLLKQDPTAFANSAITGNWVSGLQGIDGAGGRIVVTGIQTADGNGNFSNFVRDVNDNGVLDTNDTAGSGTYNVDATTGRGTATFTPNGVTYNSIIYVVNSSEFLSVTSDALSPATPILSGEYHKQTTTAFTQTSLDNNGYVGYLEGRDPANGGDDIRVVQAQFTTNGNATLTVDENDNGTLNGNNGGAELSIPNVFTIAANGRTTIPNVGVMYLIGTDSAFLVGTDSTVGFGYAQQQVGAPFSNATLSGQAFFGAGAPVMGSAFISGSAKFNGSGSVSVTQDSDDPNSLNTSTSNLSYSVTSTPAGKLTLSSAGQSTALGYVVSGSKIILMQLGAGPTIIIGQQ